MRCSWLVLALAACHAPSTDRDHDGVTDDQCPDVAEDRDGFEDTDGCPDPDNDKDGVLDAADLCPSSPEDRDGFEDADGCPDPDNDKDRIPDTSDRCPDHAETYNGYADDDGCPDPIALDYTSPTDNLFIPTPIIFAAKTSTIPDPAFITSFARYLLSEPAFEVVGVIGHNQPDEPASLADARSRAVTQSLIRAGVPASRLEPHGTTRPAREWADTPRPDGADRSVHFRWFRLSGTSIYRWDGTLDVPVRPTP